MYTERNVPWLVTILIRTDTKIKLRLLIKIGMCNLFRQILKIAINVRNSVFLSLYYKKIGSRGRGSLNVKLIEQR